jgi:hypothetical protein
MKTHGIMKTQRTSPPSSAGGRGAMQTGQGVRKAGRGSPRQEAGRPLRLCHNTLTPFVVWLGGWVALCEKARRARSDLDNLLEE